LKNGLLVNFLNSIPSYGIVGIKFDKKVDGKILSGVANAVDLRSRINNY